jgi:mannose-1-phosphate guanylyltransferase
VGGRGTRLAPLTNNTPKPMLQVAGVPFTEHQINKARSAGITEIVLATSFKAPLALYLAGIGKVSNIKLNVSLDLKIIQDSYI